MRFLILVLLAGTVASAEDLLAVAVADPLVRPGILWRCVVRGTVDPGPGAGPLVLTVSLVAGTTVLAAAEIPLPDALPLHSGVRVVLAPVGPLPPAVAPEIRARLARALPNGERPVIVRTVRVLDDPAALTRRAAAATARLDRERIADPLPRLLSEELAELCMADHPPTLEDHQLLRRTIERLEAWPAPPTASSSSGSTQLLAFRDPVDGSVQPVRLTLPANPAGAPLVVLLHAGLQVTPKVRWPTLPSTWLAAAAASGVAVCEVYPAGDLALTGVTRRRAPLAVAAARAAQPDLGPQLTIVAHEGLTSPAAWRQPRLPPPLPAARGRLAAWADGPFVVVVGTGEHAAAVADAQRLAQVFSNAWANHAHGQPPMINDRDFRPADWPGYNLVLVGSPRGNRITAGLQQTLPLTWDDRAVTWNGRSFLRSYLPGIALAVPQVQDPRLTILLLDGAPSWQATPGEQPFATEAQTADLVILPGSSTDGEAVRVLLESPATRP